MTLYQIDVEKQIGSETWTNVYHVDAASAGAADAAASALLGLERPLHTPAVIFTRYRYRVATVGSPGVVVSSGLLGTAALGGQALPLFNCMRVDFNNGTNRPARKYLRGNRGSNDVAAGYNWVAGVLTAMGTYGDGVLAITGIRDPKGRTLSGKTVISAITMHQLRRGNRKKPVI